MPATYEPIATTTVSGTGGATITFSSIPNTYSDLCLIIRGSTNGSNAVRMQLNSDTGTNYSQTRLMATPPGSTVTNNSVSQAQIDLSASASWVSTVQNFTKVDFIGYLATDGLFRSVLVSSYSDQNSATDGKIGQSVALWRNNAAAISTIYIFCATTAADLSDGTTATLYGIKRA